MNKLDILAQNRNALLLAEAVGWLHDYRKCSEEHLKAQAKVGDAIVRNQLGEKYPSLQSLILTFPIEDVSSENVFSMSVLELLNDKEDEGKKNNRLYQYLRRCHYAAHFEKIDPAGGKQCYPVTKSSSPFGFERNVPRGLTQKLWNLPWDVLQDYNPVKRKKLRAKLEPLFSQALGDTRRPINEVDLWSWGLLVSSLYKAALAGNLLTGVARDTQKLTWRLLSVRFKGMDYITSAYRIPDLLARQQLLENGLDRVRELLEVTYPLGSEIYRDENGSVYVVPDIADLLKLSSKDGSSLQTLIRNEFRQGTLKDKPGIQIGGEIEPDIQLEPEPWWGQDPEFREKREWKKHDKFGQPLNDQLPLIYSILSSTPASQPDPEAFKGFWRAKAADVCPVCGLRPQVPGGARLICDTCRKRRADRSQDWAAAHPEKTIWTGEVADVNGRLALLVGQFDLTYWLEGSFSESLFVVAPPGTNTKDTTTKAATPTRLRRIWETTRRFWQEVQDKALDMTDSGDRRLKIYLEGQPDLADFHVYDLILESTEVNVVWVPSQGPEKSYLLSAANLNYIARQLGAKETQYRRPNESARYVKDYLEKLFIEGRHTPVLYSPEHAGNQKGQNLLAGNSVTEVTYQENKYAPVIPILAEPSTFMIFVPANKSLEMIHFINEKYLREMARVRDRLPLNLGVIYAGRHMPVRSVLDAGRAVLSNNSAAEIWQVKENGLSKTLPGEALLLERNRRTFCWRLPLKMGNGTTEDCWYPYFFLASEENEKEHPAVTRREAQAMLPLGKENKQKCKVVHVADLNKDEKICLWPSLVDFEFLDTNARRFDFYYNQESRRTPTRPFYLEDIDRLLALWNDYLKYLSRNQCKQLITAIEATREQWFGQDDERLSLYDEVFYCFVADALAEAFWPQEKKWKGIPEYWRKELIKSGVRGELTDLAELHLEILKE